MKTVRITDANERGVLAGHLFASTAPEAIEKKRVVVGPDYYKTGMQIANGCAICPRCGGVGRRRKLCLICEEEGFRLVIRRKAK